MQRLSFPSLKTSTSFTWCYLLKRKPLHLLQNDQKISAYSTWTISPSNPNPLGLSTKVALSLLNSKQKVEKPLYTQARTTHPRSDILVYSSKWKNSLTKVLNLCLMYVYHLQRICFGNHASSYFGECNMPDMCNICAYLFQLCWIKQLKRSKVIPLRNLFINIYLFSWKLVPGFKSIYEVFIMAGMRLAIF